MSMQKFGFMIGDVGQQLLFVYILKTSTFAIMCLYLAECSSGGQIDGCSLRQTDAKYLPYAFLS